AMLKGEIKEGDRVSCAYRDRQVQLAVLPPAKAAAARKVTVKRAAAKVDGAGAKTAARPKPPARKAAEGKG
ncbi:hypothetical protein, partial [Providencia stuartii]|uniref:hypothetical protein n=1 Tax=Providencia stuartii TaxID=588 RepID=UPI0019539552